VIEQFDQLIALRHIAQNVQAIPNLGAGQLTEIAFNVFQQMRHLCALEFGKGSGRAVVEKCTISIMAVVSVICLEDVLQVIIQPVTLEHVPDLAL
jgi:hypothetical protein